MPERRQWTIEHNGEWVGRRADYWRLSGDRNTPGSPATGNRGCSRFGASNTLLYVYTRLVRLRLEIAPWWVHWALYCLLALGMLTVAFWDGEPSATKLTVSASVSAALGLWLALVGRRRVAFVRETLSTVEPERRAEAFNAPLFGPIPTDPAVLRAAALLAQPNLGSTPTKWVTVYTVLLILSNLDGQPNVRDLVMVAFFAAMAAYSWISPIRLDARAQLLVEAAGRQAIVDGHDDDAPITQPLELRR